MQDDWDQRREMDARLRALGLRGEQATFNAECMHCGQPFNSWTGHVSDEASLCDLCLGDD
jgi:formylmethanofuran dehydrogenase subunit E